MRNIMVETKNFFIVISFPFKISIHGERCVKFLERGKKMRARADFYYSVSQY